MQQPRKRMWIACVLGIAFVVVAGCDETRFVGVKTQVDKFVQDGEPVVDFFTQEGTQQVDSFEQSGFHQVDTFVQKAAGKIDILWVVDNSPSMQQEQTNLGNNFDRFISFIDESLIDYHVGVISTDMDQASHSGKLQGNPKVITRDLPDPQAAFAANVQVGIAGGGNEMGLVAAHEALTEPLLSTDNTGFLRDDAALAVIFVSDEDDHSFGSIGFYTRFFSSLKDIGNENWISVAAIVGDEPDGCTGSTGTAAYGERYHLLVQEIGGGFGTVLSICSDQFGTDLEDLGFTVAGLSRKFLLSREPDPTSVHVFVDEHDGAGFVEIPEFDGLGGTNWSVDLVEMALWFNAYIPGPEADIRVEYSNSESMFYLSRRVEDTSTIAVEVDDVPVPQSDDCWRYESTENAVVFYGDCIPDLGSSLTVSYSDLQNSFVLSQPVENPDTLVVEESQDGTTWAIIYEDPATGWFFHAESNSIRFQGSHIPPVGADLKVSYSNLVWIFRLSQVPQPDTIKVTLDPDGEAGPQEAGQVLEYEATANPEGWIYYGPDEAGQFANSISFEKAASPPPFQSVVTVTYTPSN